MTSEHPFSRYQAEAWPYQFRLSLHIGELHGGVPRNPDVVRSWLKAKAGFTSDLEIEAEVARIFALNPETPDEDVAAEATEKLADRHINGFRRDENGLFLEGRCLKACIKEGASVARAANKLAAKWGETNKGLLGFVAEHIMVVEDRLPLGRAEADDMTTRFVKTRFGTGISVEEVCRDVKIAATIATDAKFTDKDWAMIWLTCEQQGLGASRSQGFGRFTVTEWTRLP